MDERSMNGELRTIPLDQIKLDSTQPRVDFPEAERKELTASLLDHGQKEPITVYRCGDGFVVVSGARRRISAEDAGLPSLLAVVLDHKPEAGELYLHQLLANAHRLDLNPMELCDGYKRLMHLTGISATELAKAVSKSKTYVSNVLSLDSLPDGVKQMIRERRIGLARAALIARMTVEEQREWSTLDLSREQLERRTSRKRPEAKSVRRVTLEMPSATMSLAARMKLGVDDLIELFQSLVRECKRARTQGVDVSTLACILRDRAKQQMEGST